MASMRAPVNAPIFMRSGRGSGARLPLTDPVIRARAMVFTTPSVKVSRGCEHRDRPTFRPTPVRAPPAGERAPRHSSAWLLR